MDIASLSTYMSMSSVQQSVSIGVLSMSLDNMQEMSDGVRKMMEMSVNPGVGGNIDVSV